jgi:hypothetical protein
MLDDKKSTDVTVVFRRGSFFPVDFTIREQKIPIKRVVASWKVSRGSERILYNFSVITSHGTYVMEYDEYDKQWYYSQPGGW